MKRFLLLLSIFLMSLMASAQFVVTSFEHDEGDMKARVDAKQDRNGQYCALLKISTVGINETARQKFNFGGDMGTQIVDVSFPTGAIWVYLSPGRPTLMIKHPDLGNVMYDVPIELKPKCTYKMRIEMETATLVIKAVPAEADIYINGELVGKGYASKTVSIGAENRYKVSCDNYYPKEDVVKFEKTRTEERTVELEPNFGYITIKSEPSGADIYVDGKKVGTTPYMFERIGRGQHRIEVKKDQYEPYVNVVNIKDGDIKQLEKITLKKDPNYGTQPVSVTPVTNPITPTNHTAIIAQYTCGEITLDRESQEWGRSDEQYKTDRNGHSTALIIINFKGTTSADEIRKFSFDVGEADVIKVEKPGSLWVYVTGGIMKFEVQNSDYGNQQVEFKSIDKKKTYTLQITLYHNIQ